MCVIRNPGQYSIAAAGVDVVWNIALDFVGRHAAKRHVDGSGGSLSLTSPSPPLSANSTICVLSEMCAHVKMRGDAALSVHHVSCDRRFLRESPYGQELPLDRRVAVSKPLSKTAIQLPEVMFWQFDDIV